MNVGRMNVYRAAMLLNHHEYLGFSDWRVDKDTLDVISDYADRISQADAVKLGEIYLARGRGATE